MPTERSKMAGRRDRAQKVRAVKKTLQGKSGPRIAESGTAGYAAARLLGLSVKAYRKAAVRNDRQWNQEAKAGIKSGQLKAGKYLNTRNLSATKPSVPIKPSARQISSKRRGKK